MSGFDARPDGQTKQRISTFICVHMPCDAFCFGFPVALPPATPPHPPVHYLPEWPAFARREAAIRRAMAHDHSLLLPHNTCAWLDHSSFQSPPPDRCVFATIWCSKYSKRRQLKIKKSILNLRNFPLLPCKSIHPFSEALAGGIAQRALQAGADARPRRRARLERQLTCLSARIDRPGPEAEPNPGGMIGRA